jgi:hypothetical protein
MEDLSRTYYPDPIAALVPTSQAAGNKPSDLSAAMTAPGSPSGSVDEVNGGLSGEGDLLARPFARLSVPMHERTVVNPEASPRTPNPWRHADGTDWVQASPDVSAGQASSDRWPQS